MGVALDVSGRLIVAPTVAAALAAGAPVVALESTLISHGLPYPQNLEVATDAEAAVRSAGGRASNGCPPRRPSAGRPGRRRARGTGDSPCGLGPQGRPAEPGGRPRRRGWAATTVSATMIAAHAAGIRVFATGGIGGVHRGALGGSRSGPRPGTPAPTFDISSDLEELARTPMAVVCAGPKAILDVPATLEYLETRGVPVVAIGQDELPGFFARSAGIRAPASVPDVAAAAELVRTHLALGLGSGVARLRPGPGCRRAAGCRGARRPSSAPSRSRGRPAWVGPALTPWLLARIASLTEGASLRANTSLIVNDARVAGELAAHLTSA